MRKVRVGTAAPYDVLIGENLTPETVSRITDNCKKVILLWDEAVFSGETEIQCRVSCGGKTEAFTFSPGQAEVVKCCCLDALLQTYEKPHVDFDFDQRSICIGFE